MKDDLQQQMEASVKLHSEVAAERFRVARSPLMKAAWDASLEASQTPRAGKAGGYKFWLPEATNLVIEALTTKAAAIAGIRAKRSQIVRAGVHLLAKMTDAEFKAFIAAEYADEEARGETR